MMVRTSGIREKLRSDVLKDLARERGLKKSTRTKDTADSSHIDAQPPSDALEDDEEGYSKHPEKRMKRARDAKSSLLSMLPEPKNSSAFGPTIRLEKLLRIPQRAENADLKSQNGGEEGIVNSNDEGVLEIDIGKVVSDVTTSSSAIRELTMERSKQGAVILPQGKAKQKNQITYLAQLGKATELERKEQAAQSRMNKSAARSKYGW